jgi:hypothetical protein
LNVEKKPKKMVFKMAKGSVQKFVTYKNKFSRNSTAFESLSMAPFSQLGMQQLENASPATMGLARTRPVCGKFSRYILHFIGLKPKEKEKVKFPRPCSLNVC